MMDVYADSPPLTKQQQAVVDLPSDARALVTAGAGAGKTHTLVRRLDHLVAEEKLSAGEILVLTFSRAAVRELRNRLALHGEAARRVHVRTFDSWALDLLLQVDADEAWLERSFEARIDGARKALEDGLADELYEEDLHHVVVDEVQDLVGSRRELVEVLLDEFDCGFTMVGDPAQSIYGFTVKDVATRSRETNQFFVWLRNSFGEDLVELTLDQNFRALTDEAKIALSYGPKLRQEAEAGSVGHLHGDLRDTLRGSLNLGELDEFTCSALVDHDGTTAVLCRNNGEALLVSERLSAAAVEHRLQRSVRDRVAQAWIGMLFRAVDGSILTRSRFDELVPSLSLPEDANPGRLWRLLTRSGAGIVNDRSVDLGQLRATLAMGRLPDELTAQPPARLVVSSFHRAKGLEFDRVVIVDPTQQDVSASKIPSNSSRRSIVPWRVDFAEEARLLYVAMTRARYELLWLNAIDTRLVRKAIALDRWARYSWQPWARLGLELIGGDVFSDQPAGMRDFDADVVELQEYLSTKVYAGDEIVLERLYPQPIGQYESPPYLLLHRGRPIGTASEQFRKDLYVQMQQSKTYVPQNWPRRLTGVHVDAIETVTGSEAAGIQTGLGPYGVWLAPRLIGLSTFTYDKKSQEQESGVTTQ